MTHEGRVVYKVNQDRGLISHPALNPASHAIFGIFDGEKSASRSCVAVDQFPVARQMFGVIA